MEPFQFHTGLVAPFDRANVDTDLIIPKQFLKSIERTGFGENLFDQLRYHDEGQPGMDNAARPRNNDFILHQPRYQGASILLTRENFGCGSSREHAPWALFEYGFRVLIGPSFADIFYNNCFKNGILPIILDTGTVNALFTEVEATEGYRLTVDLEQQEIRRENGATIPFEIDGARRQKLLEGLDDIGLTLRKTDAIQDYERRAASQYPWLFTDLTDAAR